MHDTQLFSPLSVMDFWPGITPKNLIDSVYSRQLYKHSMPGKSAVSLLQQRVSALDTEETQALSHTHRQTHLREHKYTC